MKFFSFHSVLRSALVALLAMSSMAISAEILYNAPLVPMYELRSNAARNTYPDLLVNEYRNSYYTTDPATRDFLKKLGWVGGDTVFAYVPGSQAGSTNVPDLGAIKGLRRTFVGAPRTEHFYTTDQADVNVLVPTYGYAYEGQSGGLFTSDVTGNLIPLNRLWKDWGAGKAEHRFIRGAAKNQTQPYQISKQYFVTEQGYVDDRVEGYAALLDLNSSVSSYGCKAVYYSPFYCYRIVEAYFAVPAVCINDGAACDEALGTGMVCGGVVHLYDANTGELLATESNFKFGPVPASTDYERTRYACVAPRAFLPNSDVFHLNGSPYYRMEFSGFTVVYSTLSGGVSTKVVAPGRYLF